MAPPDDQTDDQTAQTEPQTNGKLATAISTMVVRVLRKHTGRGPTKSRTNLSDDLIWVVVEDTLTHAERTLVANGKADLVVHVRQAFQDIMSAELIAGVEALSNRTVTAFFSDNTLEPDLAVEFFLLAPRAHGPERRPGTADAWHTRAARDL